MNDASSSRLCGAKKATNYILLWNGWKPVIFSRFFIENRHCQKAK
jgi:hypothetical protein